MNLLLNSFLSCLLKIGATSFPRQNMPTQERLKCFNLTFITCKVWNLSGNYGSLVEQDSSSRVYLNIFWKIVISYGHPRGFLTLDTLAVGKASSISTYRQLYVVRSIHHHYYYHCCKGNSLIKLFWEWQLWRKLFLVFFLRFRFVLKSWTLNKYST